MSIEQKNTEVAFSNVPGKTNFKEKNEADMMASIEPETNLGFLSRNRNYDISDHFFTYDAMVHERNIEDVMKNQEEQEIARFRMSSVYRPASSSQSIGAINMKKHDKGETTKVKVIMTKKRKFSKDDTLTKECNRKETSGSKVSEITSVNEVVEAVTVLKNDNVTVGTQSSSLSSLLGAYDDEDSD